MNRLIKQALINDPQSPFNGKTVDILIQNGVIHEIGDSISAENCEVLDFAQATVSPGWVDIFAHLADPGLEHKETIATGLKAAAAGGYTGVMCIPNTNPVIDNKTQIEYLLHQSSSAVSTIFPIGAVSKKAAGQDLAEMHDMKNSGAVAFSDGTHPIQSSGILVKALQYVKAFDGVIIQIPDDTSLGGHGQMHEGLVSTQLGMPGKPMLAEELIVARDIKLARYAESKIHFTGVTSPKSLEYIRRAKESGAQVTCSVTPHHLFFTDKDLWEYDSNLKVYPPLRTEKEVSALKAAVLDGTVDSFATHHLPHEIDSKMVEFEYAGFGIIGLQTSYSVLQTVLEDLPNSKWTELLSINPRKIFGLPAASITVGAKADLTIYKSNDYQNFTSAAIHSKSKNTPFLNRNLKGKVLGVINGSKLHLN